MEDLADRTGNADSVDNADQQNQSDGLNRGMTTRHLTMISIGGVIGTGLFVSTGYTIHQAGPLGVVLAYAVGSLLVYFVMLCLGELSVAMPYAGSFHLYANRFIGPGTAFTVAILYWLNWAVALASEFTAAGLLMQRWFPNSPTWVWSALFIAVVFILNILSVRAYGEAEFWFSSIKVITIVAFIVIGLLAVFGIIPIKGYSHAPLLTNFYADGLFPNGITPVLSTLLTVVFAFSGTEVVAVAAGETKNPGKAIPKAVHSTVFRLTVFFIGSIAVMAALIPWQKAGVDTSPFVLVFERIGMSYAGDIMNFVVLTALLSAANSGLYVSARMVWSLARERMIPKVLAKTNFHGVPVWAVVVSMAGSLLALLSSVIAASTVYLALVAISGLATLVVWISVAVCQILFRRERAQQGKSPDDLGYKAPLYPFTPWAVIVMIAALVLVALDPDQRSTLFYMIPFIAACYVFYYAREAWRKRHPVDDSPII